MSNDIKIDNVKDINAKTHEISAAYLHQKKKNRNQIIGGA